MKILLDPGHGPGRAYNRGSVIGNEGDNNFLFARCLEKELEKFGFIVASTRKSAADNPTLMQRGRMAEGYDLFISLHSNAGPSSVRGMEIYGDVNNNDPKLMRRLVNEVSRAVGTKNRGVRYRTRKDGAFHIGDISPGGSNYYGVLYHNRAKIGMLVESVFHTNVKDCEIYTKKRGRLAAAFAKTLADYYNPPQKILYSCHPDGASVALALAKKNRAPILPHDYFNGTSGSWKSFKDKGYRIVAVGGRPSNHTAYADGFVG